MTTEAETILTFTAPDRRVLIARLCGGLRNALVATDGWGRGALVVPWHVTAPSFDELPGRVIAALLDEWDETATTLVEIEFSGYLETDAGPRAWGSLVLDAERARSGRLEIDAVTVVATESGYRVSARIRPEGRA